MEDIRIWRKTRYQQIVTQQLINAGNRSFIPGNPSRMSLIISASTIYANQIALYRRDDITSLILRFNCGGNGYGEMPVFDGFGLLPSEPFYAPLNPHILHIRDYGQILLNDLWFGPIGASATFNVFETFLMERQSSDL